MRFPFAAGAAVLLAFGASFALARAVLTPGEPGALANVSTGPGIDPGTDAPAGTLDVLLDGPDLFVDLDVPPAALLGFDRAPSSAAERAAMARAHRLLDAGDLLVPSPAARCALDQSFATLGHGYDDLCSVASGEPGRAVAPPADPSATSSPTPSAPGPLPEAAARWSWFCEAPERLERVEVRLFDAFDGLGPVDVTLAGPAGDARAKLAPERPAIELDPVR